MAPDDALRDWIRSEMTMEKPDILTQVKQRVARLLGVSSDGKVAFRISDDQAGRLGADEKILLYVMGKLYAQAAGYTETDSVSNAELQRELGMPEGTVRAKLTGLRRAGFLTSDKPGSHAIVRNRITAALGDIERKLGE